MYLEVSLLPIPQQLAWLGCWVGVEPSSLISLHLGTSQHTSEKMLTGSSSRSPACEHRSGWTNSPSLTYIYHVTPKEGDVPFLRLHRLPSALLNANLILILNIKTAFWSSWGTDHWLHYKNRRRLGSQVLPRGSVIVSIKVGWRLSLQTQNRTPSLLGCSAANEAEEERAEARQCLHLTPDVWWAIEAGPLHASWSLILNRKTTHRSHNM